MNGAFMDDAIRAPAFASYRVISTCEIANDIGLFLRNFLEFSIELFRVCNFNNLSHLDYNLIQTKVNMN
jgi:hypothetical protein